MKKKKISRVEVLVSGKKLTNKIQGIYYGKTFPAMFEKYFVVFRPRKDVEITNDKRAD